MEMTRIGSLTVCLFATTRARSISKITAAFANLRLRKILDICYAQCLVSYVLTWSKHCHILQQGFNYPFMLEDIGPITQNSLKIALECYYSLKKYRITLHPAGNLKSPYVQLFGLIITAKINVCGTKCIG